MGSIGTVRQGSMGLRRDGEGGGIRSFPVKNPTTSKKFSSRGQDGTREGSRFGERIIYLNSGLITYRVLVACNLPVECSCVTAAVRELRVSRERDVKKPREKERTSLAFPAAIPETRGN